MTYLQAPATRRVVREDVHAGWWARCVAVLIDGVVVAVAVLLVVAVLAPPTDDSAAGDSLAGVTGLVLLVAWAAYWVIGWGSRPGQTLGKKTLSIAVRRTDGSQLGYGRALWRLVTMQLLWLLPPLGLVATLWPIWDTRKQTWWDKLAGSVVVRTAAVAPATRADIPASGVALRAPAAGSTPTVRRPRRASSPPLDDAAQLRYERGEISREEYERLQAFRERIRRETGA